MIATLQEVLNDARASNQAVAGLVCLGWEDMRAYVKAAELEEKPASFKQAPVVASTRRYLSLDR